jgi:hypothetical protein
MLLGSFELKRSRAAFWPILVSCAAQRDGKFVLLIGNSMLQCTRQKSANFRHNFQPFALPYYVPNKGNAQKVKAQPTMGPCWMVSS